jgi:uncharacterized membrane protein HdeD (DUF308 family)
VSGLPAWIPQLARGVLAIALGVTITLTLDHSATFGLLAFGVFATVTGAVLLLGSSRGPYAGSARPLFLGHGAVSLVAGIAALAAPFAGVPYLALVVGVFALLTGGLELTSGLRTRRSAPAARDWILVGAATVVLGVVALLLPTDLAEPFAGEKGVAGTLTSSIVLIGVLGAWAVVVGVLQTISAVSLRGARTTRVGAP